MPTNRPNTTPRMVQVDLDNLPPLTDAQKKRLEALAKMPDEQIDYSDAPFLPDAVWIKPMGGPIKSKQQISLRIDADVLDFFRTQGRRYQTRINAVLRAYVEAAKRAKTV